MIVVEEVVLVDEVVLVLVNKADIDDRANSYAPKCKALAMAMA
jgi:hypothetical protein